MTSNRSAARPALPFSSWRRYGFAFTLAMLAVTAVSLATRGLNFGLDFTGGVVLESRSEPGFDSAALREALTANGVSDVVIQLGEGGHVAHLRAQAAEGEIQRVGAAMKAALGEGAAIRKLEAVGPKVSGELLRRGLLAAGLGVVAISLYVWLRFEVKFGYSALITTFHDVIAIIGLFALTGLTFDLSTIAALLAVAGYSINDTVVVFDRIRETLGRDQAAALESVIDRSITDTLRRTLATSGTTLLTALSLLIFGGPVLFGFAAAITFGILIGTYSSIFVAAPLLIHLPGRLPGRPDPDQPEAPDGMQSPAE